MKSARDSGENHVVLLVALAILIPITIAVTDPRYSLVIGIGFIVGLCVAASMVTRSRRPLRILVPWGLAALGLHVVFPGSSGPVGLEILDSLLWMGFSAYLAASVFRRVLAARRVGTHQVSGALSIYLLTGLLFAQAYEILMFLHPGAIYFAPQATGVVGPGELLYFSFVTLATVGYGDAYPVTSAARALCVLESIVGVLYVAVLIARFVGRYEDEPRG